MTCRHFLAPTVGCSHCEPRSLLARDDAHLRRLARNRYEPDWDHVSAVGTGFVGVALSGKWFPEWVNAPTPVYQADRVEPYVTDRPLWLYEYVKPRKWLGLNRWGGRAIVGFERDPEWEEVY